MLQLELLLPDAAPNNVVIQLRVHSVGVQWGQPSHAKWSQDWYLGVARRVRPYLSGEYGTPEILQLIHAFTQRNRIKECAAREVLAAGEHEVWVYSRDETKRLAWRMIEADTDDGSGTSATRSGCGPRSAAKTG